MKTMENILLTLLILTITAAAAVLALKNRASHIRPGSDLSSARQHRELTRRYHEEQASLTD